MDGKLLAGEPASEEVVIRQTNRQEHGNPHHFPFLHR
jgi:hypothetical protein